MQIKEATIQDLEALAGLFDAYRRWYRMEGDLKAARTFLEERLSLQQSKIFLAVASDGSPAGFTQLYPSFSSVSMARIYVLNDLFVAEDFRRLGVGRMLLRAARDWGKQEGSLRLHLETEENNIHAQALYEDEGYVAESGFIHYNLAL